MPAWFFIAFISVAVPSASETRFAVRSSLVAKLTRTWQLSRIELLAPYTADLVERLGDEEGFHAVAGHEGERAFEEVEAAESRKLVEHHQHAVPPGLGVQILGQAATDLVEHKPDQRLGARMSDGGTTR